MIPVFFVLSYFREVVPCFEGVIVVICKDLNSVEKSYEGPLFKWKLWHFDSLFGCSPTEL